MKTNEFSKPWIEDRNEQSIDKNLLSKAKDQLMRAFLRFLELLPEVKCLGKIDFQFFAAFPFVRSDPGTKDSSLLLTYQDLLSKEKLREKLNLTPSSANNIELYQKIVHLLVQK